MKGTWDHKVQVEIIHIEVHINVDIVHIYLDIITVFIPPEV